MVVACFAANPALPDCIVHGGGLSSSWGGGPTLRPSVAPASRVVYNGPYGNCFVVATGAPGWEHPQKNKVPSRLTDMVRTSLRWIAQFPAAWLPEQSHIGTPDSAEMRSRFSRSSEIGMNHSDEHQTGAWMGGRQCYDQTTAVSTTYRPWLNPCVQHAPRKSPRACSPITATQV